MADKIVCTPQIMEEAAKSFEQLSEELRPIGKRLLELMDKLLKEDGGSWQGLGRDAFDEKWNEVISSSNDIGDALKAGSRLSNMLLRTMSEGVEESTRLLNQIAIEE